MEGFECVWQGSGFSKSQVLRDHRTKITQTRIECVLSRHDVFSAKSMELRNVQEVLPAWHQFLKLNLQKLLKLDWGGVGFFLLEKTNGENNWPRPICVEAINVNPDRTREILLWQLTFDCFFFSESSMSNSNNSQRIRLIERIEQTQLIDLSKIIINKSDLMLLKTKWHANDWIVFFDVKSSLSGFNYWNLVDLGPSSRVARWWLRRHENRCMARLGCPLLAGHKRRGGFRGLESWG